MLGIGAPELAIIAVIALLIFGPRQLPKMGRALGQTLKEVRGIQSELERSDED